MTGADLPAPLSADDGEALSDRAERTVRALCEHPLLDATWSRYEPGEQGPDPHIHRDHADAFFIVEGELRFGLGPAIEPLRAPVGTFVLVPPNLVHTFANESTATARWLNFHAPSTGFIASLRGDRDGFDSHDVPGGGRAAADAVVASASTSDPADGDGLGLAILARDPRLAVSELDLAPGSEMAAASHAGTITSFFVLAGEIEFAFGARRVRAGQRAWLSVPPGALHAFRNAGQARARMLSACAPGAPA